jgi:putative membrane protein
LPNKEQFMDILPWYQASKSLHLIGMVSWMAGLFYLVRIMVNHAEALAGNVEQRDLFATQYAKMEWKAWRVIIVPAIVITWTFGTAMLGLQSSWLQQPWMQVKLLFLGALTGYSWYCKIHIQRLEQRNLAFTHVYYRALNEVPTIIMVAIIFLAVFKSNINWYYLCAGVLLFTGLIFYAVKKVAQKMNT